MNRSVLKAAAKQSIKGNVGMLFVIAVLTAIITGTGIGALLTPALTLSLVAIYLNMAKGVKPGLGDMFCRIGAWGKSLWLSIITVFFVSMWSLLFCIPGIIKSYAYSMAPYVLAENPNMTAREALNVSKRITQGHKMDLFVLQLSFIGWYLLGVITFGIAFIYVIPYMNATMTEFYNTIKDPAVVVEG